MINRREIELVFRYEEGLPLKVTEEEKELLDEGRTPIIHNNQLYWVTENFINQKPKI